ncbi:hypothetical protein K438DRAFT_1783822 [Mycena galopus ATCC 62051]|nr:hypothetical protein K438DRAFT_1783822 [Mycena galopus ATCC 62051]
MEMDIPRPAHATLADVEGLFEILFFWQCADAQNREFRIFRREIEGLIDRHLERELPFAAQDRKAVKRVSAFRRWKDDACGSKTFHRHGPWPCTWRLRWEGTLDEAGAGTDAGGNSVRF